MVSSNPAYAFNPNEGPAKGVRGVWPFQELRLDEVRILPSDATTIVSRQEVELKRVFNFKHAGVSVEMLPLMASNMFGVGTLSMAQALSPLGIPVALEKNIAPADVITFYNELETALAFPTTGFRNGDEEKLSRIFTGAGLRAPQAIIVDVPNGHMEKTLDTIKRLRENYPGVVIIAGNVAMGSMAEKLIEAGADAVKVGIGPGGACTTKLIAGTHRPQFAAIRECAEAVHSMGGYVIADGGVRTAGDVAVALAAGGDIVMMGTVLAGYDQGGEPIYIDDKGGKWMVFMGSSSAAYMQMTQGGVAQYRAAEGELQWKRYKGNILAPDAIIHETLGGIRSAMTYVGVITMQEFADAARKCYRGEEGGLYLVKADVALALGGKDPIPHIVTGIDNPLTHKMPLSQLIMTA